MNPTCVLVSWFFFSDTKQIQNRELCSKGKSDIPVSTVLSGYVIKLRAVNSDGFSFIRFPDQCL